MPYRQVHGSGDLGELSGYSKSTYPVGYTIGEVRYNDTHTKKFRLFWNATGASLPTGTIWARDIAGGGPYTITVSTTTELGITNAVCCLDGNTHTKTIPTASFFWGCVWGHPVALLASNISVGTAIAVCATAGGKVIPATVTTGTHFAYNEGDLTTTTTGLATNNTDTVGGRYMVYFEDCPNRVGQKYGRTP